MLHCVCVATSLYTSKWRWHILLGLWKYEYTALDKVTSWQMVYAVVDEAERRQMLFVWVLRLSFSILHKLSHASLNRNAINYQHGMLVEQIPSWHDSYESLARDYTDQESWSCKEMWKSLIAANKTIGLRITQHLLQLILSIQCRCGRFVVMDSTLLFAWVLLVLESLPFCLNEVMKQIQMVPQIDRK